MSLRDLMRAATDATDWTVQQLELERIRKARDFYRSQLAELDRREQELAQGLRPR